MGVGSIVLIVGAVGGVVAVVAGIVMMRSSEPPLASGQRPSLPPRPAPPAPAPAAASAHVVVNLRAGTSLAAQLRQHANAAEDRGLRPFFEIGASWCPPSRMFGEALDDPRMEAALTGIYLMRADTDDFNDDAHINTFNLRAVPVFFELDAEGEATGRSINGGAWGADTVENMSRTMAAFFAG